MNLIVGVGNTLRCDEGVGPAAVQRILTRGALPPGVEAVDAGTPGFAILDLARSARRMVVIDAMRAGGAPGTVYVVSPERVRSRGREFTESLHGVSILGALRLARAVGELLPEVCLVGVEPQELGWGAELSPPVSAALDRAADEAIAQASLE